jgi:hypothetical protein
VNAEQADVARIRSAYLRRAVLWVCELAERDRLEAHDLAGQLGRYFQSVLYSLPPEERNDLSKQIDEICGNFKEFEADCELRRRY